MGAGTARLIMGDVHPIDSCLEVDTAPHCVLYVSQKLSTSRYRAILYPIFIPQTLDQWLLRHFISISYISHTNFRQVDTAPHCILYSSYKFPPTCTAVHRL